MILAQSMAQPSVVSPSSSASPPSAIDTQSFLSMMPDAGADLFGGDLFSNPDGGSLFEPPVTTSPTGPNDQQPTTSRATQEQFFDFSQDHEMMEQQPGSSQQQQQRVVEHAVDPVLEQQAPATSPQSSLELSSIQQSLEKNRESLKHKLSTRASIRELVNRGIYPCK